MSILRKGNKELIKDINRYTVLNLIRERGAITRTEIAKECDFGMSTLTYILDDLQSNGLITEGKEISSTGGRRAKLIQFNSEYGFIVSVKIEEERLLFALTDLDAAIIESTEVAFEEHSSPEKIVALITENVNALCERKKISEDGLLGIGIAVSGLVDRKQGVVIRSTMLGWEKVSLVAMLAEYFPGISIFVDKNINCYTLAELWLGEGRQSSNFVCVSVGAGLGLSIVIGRQIYYGVNGGAGEFGHTTLYPNGYQCHCGQKGCLEMYASEFYFRNRVKELKSEPNHLADYHFDLIGQEAKNANPLAEQLMHDMGTNLGVGLRNLINTFNPEKVILAGEGLHHQELFLEETRRVAAENFFSKVEKRTEITTSLLEDTAWLQGAALLVIHQLFQVPIYEEQATLI
ncbi:ROK family transcriptional regulator [Listeria costaricensis]|uniref:ROK family transcriptional regulator n=1 Tax=Listeria costaricensis TaxID=2026604 RepID=UPI000C08942C|nr:ROK family transcriptional regulator [Listeria costaricensis]